MKKVLPGILSLAIMVQALPAFAADVFVSDGTIRLTGEIKKGELNDIVTVNVIKSDFDWDSEDVWNTDEYEKASENLKFYDIIKLDPNGKYDISFNVDEMGKYTVYFGSEYFTEPQIQEFFYTNKEAADEIAQNLKNAESANEVAELLKNNRYAFSLYSEYYNEADLDVVGKLVFDYIQENQEDNMTNLIYKGIMTNLLNTKDIENLSDYSEIFGMDDSCIMEYWQAEYGKKIAEILKDEDFETIEEYDEAMFYATGGCIISENDGTAGIKAFLEEHIERADSNKKITSTMCKEIAGEGLYTKADLDDWLDSYKEPSGSNGSSGGGGGGSKKNNGGYKTNQYEAANDILFTGGTEFTKPNNTQKNEGMFTDLDSVEWAREAVEALCAKGIIQGRGDRIFVPNDRVTREEFVKLLMLAFNLNIVGDDLTFSDVDKNAWYYKYVNCAFTTGIVKGYSEDAFGIGQPISRQDLCVMVANAIRVCEIEFSENRPATEFTDSDRIADYAKSAVEQMQKMGIVNGYGDGSFNPTGTATRAEAAKIIYLLTKVENI